jgi:hypothetical protein
MQFADTRLRHEPGRGLSAANRLPAATTHARPSDPTTRHAGASNRYRCSARGDASCAMNASRAYQRVRGRRVLHDHEQGHCRDNKIFHGYPPFAPLADVGHSTRRVRRAYAKSDPCVPRAAYVREAERSVCENVPLAAAPPTHAHARYARNWAPPFFPCGFAAARSRRTVIDFIDRANRDKKPFFVSQLQPHAHLDAA